MGAIPIMGDHQTYLFLVALLNWIPECAFSVHGANIWRLLLEVVVSSNNLPANVTRQGLAIRACHLVTLRGESDNVQ